MFDENDLKLILTLADRIQVSGRESRLVLAALEQKCVDALKELSNAPKEEAVK